MPELIDADRELIQEANRVLRAHYAPAKHTTGAALRAASGAVYTAVSMKANTAKADVHAEPIAVDRAILNGETVFDTVAAVQFLPGATGTSGDTRVVSACGVCRELLLGQSPGISIVIDEDGLEKRPVADLLPA